MKKTKMLKKNYEFSRIFSKGTYYSGEVIEAFILSNNEKSNYLGLAISVKLGHAYQRNKIKRLLRESYYKLEKSINIGNSIVFLLKKNVNINTVNYNQVQNDMFQILNKAKILNES